MSINEDIMKFMRSRQEEGERKYGKTIERDDLKPSAWARHALEEMADGVQYAVRCVETVERLEYAATLALAEFTAQIAKMPDGPQKDRIVGIARKLVVALDGGEKNAVGLPWHEAPHRCDWAAMDIDGAWHWYRGEPRIGSHGRYWVTSEGSFGAFNCDLRPDWTQSKQRRPE
jgi:hypothetical protein